VRSLKEAQGGELVARLGLRVRETLRDELAGVEQVALVDFPNHYNVGDAAIWLGEVAALRSLGIRIAYACDESSYVADHLKRALGPHGAILLHGGGNLGELYAPLQRLREQILSDFRRTLTIQLPQTIARPERRTEKRMQAVLARHERVRILARDQLTLDWFSQHFDVPVRLCPDSAFCLGHRRLPQGSGVLWLAREDEEARRTNVDLPAGLTRQDWPPAPPIWRVRRRVSRLVGDGTRRLPVGGRALAMTAMQVYPRLAAERLEAGIGLLGGARAVVTDRLHAHIFSLMCDVPHVLLDNSTGKVRSFYETWTAESPLAHWADSAEDAVEQALALTR
jgi:exopolysaccharide biosynthesis predicted pyruvyltransferase EpsI